MSFEILHEIYDKNEKKIAPVLGESGLNKKSLVLKMQCKKIWLIRSRYVSGKICRVHGCGVNLGRIKSHEL